MTGAGCDGTVARLKGSSSGIGAAVAPGAEIIGSLMPSPFGFELLGF